MKRTSSHSSNYIRAANPVRRVFAGLVVLLLLAGCGPNSTPTPAPAPTTAAAVVPAVAATTAATSAATAAATSTSAQVVATPSVTAAAQAATPTEQTVATAGTAGATAGSTSAATGKTFQNPILQSDFADPDVIHVGDTFYGYATESNSAYVTAARSKDMVNWEVLPDVMPVIPPWADMSHVDIWAPSVIEVGQKFIMYFSAREAKSGKECLGQAVADKPEGRFNKTSDQPFMCKPEVGGQIDPFVFQDGDKLYLYWKDDSNSIQLPATIWTQELSPDGLSLVGSPSRLISNDEVWEGRVVEAPEMFKHDSRYYLFFSGGFYGDATYATGYAACDGPLGPCTQAPESENPILKSKMDAPPLVMGPGGETLLQVGDQTWIFYHAWQVLQGTKTDNRLLWLDKLDWKDGKPIIDGPTTGSQAVPVIP